MVNSLNTKLKRATRKMKDDIKTPCKECPFRKTAIRGWLGGLTAQETKDAIMAEQDFSCHLTRKFKKNEKSRCKGSVLFLINHCKQPRMNLPLIDAVNKTKKEQHSRGDYLGFDFVAYHTL